MSKVYRVFGQEFKATAVGRMLAGENVCALARELKVLRKDLYVWRARFKAGGVEALRGRGQPAKAKRAVAPAPAKSPGKDLAAARDRIVALERKIGQQQVDLDFFRAALRRIGDASRPGAEPGATASMRSSKR